MAERGCRLTRLRYRERNVGTTIVAGYVALFFAASLLLGTPAQAGYLNPDGSCIRPAGEFDRSLEALGYVMLDQGQARAAHYEEIDSRIVAPEERGQAERFEIFVGYDRIAQRGDGRAAVVGYNGGCVTVTKFGPLRTLRGMLSAPLGRFGP